MYIFDLDGTLIDSSEGIVMAVTYVLDELGLQIKNGKGLFQFIGPPIEEQFVKACGLSVFQAQKARDVFVDYYEKNCLDMFTTYDGVEIVLKELHQKVEMAIATYKPANQTAIILDKCGLDKYFTYVACAESGKGKNKSDLVLECLENSRVRTDDNIYIGDTINDEMAAKNCNIKFVAASYGFEKEAFLPTTKVIESFGEIITIK